MENLSQNTYRFQYLEPRKIEFAKIWLIPIYHEQNTLEKQITPIRGWDGIIICNTSAGASSNEPFMGHERLWWIGTLLAICPSKFLFLSAMTNVYALITFMYYFCFPVIWLVWPWIYLFWYWVPIQPTQPIKCEVCLSDSQLGCQYGLDSDR